ncbi:MAG: hypothetical protein RSE25_09515 [Bacteroidales bacterium]
MIILQTTLDQSLAVIKASFITSNIVVFQYFGCAVGLLVSILFIGNIVSASFMKLESINWHVAARPLVIAFIISVYPDLIIKPLDFFTSFLNNVLTETIVEKKKSIEFLNANVEKNISKRVTNQMQRYGVDITDPKLQEYIGKNRGTALGDSFAAKLSDEKVYTPTENELKKFIEQTRPEVVVSEELGIAGSVATWIIGMLEKISGAFIRTLSVFCLIILSLFGPITFAFAILPAWKDGIASWFARYIQISFWIPLSQIFSYIVLSTKETVLKQATVGDAISSPTTAILCLSAVSVIGMFMIPTIAEWIISSGGAGSFPSTVANSAKSLGSKALGM